MQDILKQVDDEASRYKRRFLEEGDDFRLRYADFFPEFPTGSATDWTLEEFEISTEFTMDAVRNMFDGRGYYPGKYYKLTAQGRGVIMSNTPAEIRDHLPIYHEARGRVLINGLGMGMIAYAMAMKESVDHIDIVELDSAVIQLVGSWLTDKFPGKITIHHGNAYMKKWPKGVKFDVIWHDIWDTICGDNLEGMSKLSIKYRSRLVKGGYQDCWCRGICEQNRY